MPQLPGGSLATADAAAATTATKFGASGLRVWDNYDINTNIGSDPALAGICGCEPSIGVDWIHGSGKDALYQALSTTVCAAWNDAVPIGVAPAGTFTDCTSPYNSLVNNGGPANVPLVPNGDPILYTDFDGGRTFAGGLVATPEPPNNAATAAVCGATVMGPVNGQVYSATGHTVGCRTGCTVLSYTNTHDGSDGWNPAAPACALPAWDHESIAAGPWAFPPPAWAAPGSRAVYYCAQAAGVACYISYDGGATFLPMDTVHNPSAANPGTGLNANLAQCHGIHGHLRIGRMYTGDDVGETGGDAPDGMGYVYLPNKGCRIGSGGPPATECFAAPVPATCQTGFMYSKDNGLSWELVVRPPTSAPQPCTGSGPLLRPGHFDPSIAPSLDNGWIYFGQGEASAVAGAPGGAYVAVSKTNGVTWEDVGTGNDACPGTKYYEVGHLVGVQQATFAEMIAGDDDRAAFAFLGSKESADDYDMCGGGASAHIWHMYVALTYDAGKTWEVDQVTKDPVQRGGIWPYGATPPMPCRNLLDFNDIATDKEGRVVVAYTDGCVGACAGPGGTVASSIGRDAVIARQRTGRGLLSAYDIPDPAPLPLDDTQSGPSAPGPTQPGPPDPNVSDTSDSDQDGILDANDNCKKVPNSDQADADLDAAGNACDPDDDADGVLDGADLCPIDKDPLQLDADRDGKGDACDEDADGDGVLNAADNCWRFGNPGQEDLDADGEGDLCDGDLDGDGVPNGQDGPGGALARDGSRWSTDPVLLQAIVPDQTEDVRPVAGVEGLAAGGSSSSFVGIAIVAGLVLASIAVLLLATLRRRPS